MTTTHEILKTRGFLARVFVLGLCLLIHAVVTAQCTNTITQFAVGSAISYSQGSSGSPTLSAPYVFFGTVSLISKEKAI